MLTALILLAKIIQHCGVIVEAALGDNKWPHRQPRFFEGWDELV